MRCNSLVRAGTVGAIGMGLFVGLGTHANICYASPAAQTRPQPQDHSATPPDAAPEIGANSANKASLASQITPWHQITVESGDSLSKVFAKAGLQEGEWASLLNIGDKVAPLKTLQPGETLEIRKTPSGKLSQLRYKLDATDFLSVTRIHEPADEASLQANIVHRDSQNRRITASGTVGSSLSGSLAAAGVPARIATELAGIYRYRANLSRNMHTGDRFSVIYRARFVNDEPVATGPVIAASIAIRRSSLDDYRILKAFRAIDNHGDVGYYDASGHPYKPSFSRRPVNYSRISSRFNPNRMHPILHIRRPHWGVDMAAPRGTPIHAAAEGTVRFVGRKHGYGRLVELDHFDGYSTRYGHMFKFAKNLHDGEHVARGQVIGYVGETGEATGPHLHFEIRKNGVAHNPLTTPLPEGHPLAQTRLAVFANRIQPLIVRLDNIPGMNNLLTSSTTGLTTGSGCGNASVVNVTLPLAPAQAPASYSLSGLLCVADSAKSG